MTDETLPEDPRDALIREQAARITVLEAQVADLSGRLEAALRAASRNSGNSSMPPSGDDQPGKKPPRKQRRAAERAEGKKKPGGQPGAPGAAMCWKKADKVFEEYPGGACSCGRDLAEAADLGVESSYQQEDVPEPQPSRRYQYNLHKAKCACGKEHVAPRPDGVPAARLPVGPRLSALALCLTIFQHVPVERAQQLISDLAGGVVSTGFVRSVLGRAAGLVKDSVGLIRTLIAASPVAGSGETTLRSGPAGEKKYVHGAFTELYSCFHLGTRSLETMKEAGILPFFAGIVVSDRYVNYFSETWTTFAGNQACCAHYADLRIMRNCAAIAHMCAVQRTEGPRGFGIIRTATDRVGQEPGVAAQERWHSSSHATTARCRSPAPPRRHTPIPQALRRHPGLCRAARQLCGRDQQVLLPDRHNFQVGIMSVMPT